jgi:uncharacterized membrane protein
MEGMARARIAAVSAVAAWLAVLPPLDARAAATLVGLGADQAAAVSGDGGTVVGRHQNQAYRWTAGGGIQLLGFLQGGTQSAAVGVSRDGAVVVGRSLVHRPRSPGIEIGEEAFRFAAGAMTGLGTIPMCFGFLCGTLFSGPGVATDVSESGATIVGARSVFVEIAVVRWSPAPADLALSTGLAAQIAPDGWLATGVSADGQIAVGFVTQPPTTPPIAMRWDGAGSATPLGLLPGHDRSRAHGISRDGGTSVGESGSTAGLDPVRWTGVDPVALGALPGGTGRGVARAVAHGGSPIVGRPGSPRRGESKQR